MVMLVLLVLHCNGKCCAAAALDGRYTAQTMFLVLTVEKQDLANMRLQICLFTTLTMLMAHCEISYSSQRHRQSITIHGP